MKTFLPYGVYKNFTKKYNLIHVGTYKNSFTPNGILIKIK